MPPARRALLGYCTNVHPAASFEAVRDNLARHAVDARAILLERGVLAPDEPLGVGLWFPASAARAALDRESRGGADRLRGLRDDLRARGLLPHTVNGFPHGDFHAEVVKRAVYLPDWTDPARLAYTLDLVAILHALLPDDRSAGISTLPVAWGRPAPASEALDAAAANLRAVADTLADLEAETGRPLHVDIEPEPGCALERADDVVRLFRDHILRGQSDRRAERLLRYLRVCHDVCHAAVMFEPQRAFVDALRSAGIAIGKVQVSAAVRVPPGAERQPGALDQLAAFAEDRYLHQTSIRVPGRPDVFHEDLPDALDAARSDPGLADGEWRVHFHVPIDLDRFGALETTNDQIPDALDAALEHSPDAQIEVETYAWGVLPPELRADRLAAGIARELAWLRASGLA